MAAQTDDARSKDESLHSCFEEMNYMINNITFALLPEQQAVYQLHVFSLRQDTEQTHHAASDGATR